MGALNHRNGRFTLLQQNDVHGQLDVHWEHFWRGGGAEYRRVGGMARAAAVAREVARETGASLLIDCGDALHGTLPVIRTEGDAMRRALDAAGVDLLVPGNWDFGYGPDVLRRIASELQADVLAANVEDAASGELLFPATCVREVGGVRVGFVGLASSIVPNMSARFAAGLRFPDARRVLPRALRSLHDSGDCDVVVLVSHLGLAQDIALAREIDGIDVILSGHTHNRLDRPLTVGRTLIIQSGFSGSFLGRLDLEVSGGRVVDWRHRLIELGEAITPDPETAALVDEEIAPFREEMKEPVGRTEVALHRMGLLETPMDNLIVDAYRELTGAEVALSRGWRFGPPVPPGPVTMGDLWSMIPTNPEVFVTRLTGEQLRASIETNLHEVFAGDPFQQAGGYVVRAAGVHVVFRPSLGRGARIEHIEIAGAPYDPDREYTVASAGGHDVPANTLRLATGVHAHEAVRRYFAARHAVSPGVTGTTFVPQ